MNKLTYAQKFSVLALIYFVSVSVVMYNLYAHLGGVIQSSQRQLTGAVMVKSLTQTIQLMQEHRSLLSGVLSGNQAMQQLHDVKEAEIEAAISTLNQQWRGHPDWQLFKIAWQTLRTKESSLSSTDNFIAQTELIDQLQQFKISVAKIIASLDHC